MGSDAKVYAESLLTAATDPHQMWHELITLTEVLERTPHLKQVLTDLSLETPAERSKVLAKYLSEFSVELQRLVGLLLDEAQLDSLADIAAAYRERYKATHPVVEVSLESATPLSAANRKHLLDSLPLGGRQPLLTENLDPSLIGGVRVVIDDTEYDYSLAGALTNLEEHLTT